MDELTASHDAYARNAKWARDGLTSYVTALDPTQEMQFREWVEKGRIPFDPDQLDPDYDMRGYWTDGQQGGAQVNANDGQPHYPDTYKTPFHQSFSRESRYARPDAPYWANDHQLVDPATGEVVYDERPAKAVRR